MTPPPGAYAAGPATAPSDLAKAEPASPAGAAPAPTPDRDGVHDFDFEFGTWKVHHRRKRGSGDGGWEEFEGTSHARPILDGAGNVEDNVFYTPNGIQRGVALRTYDPQTRQWAIWWVSSAQPHTDLGSGLRGRFENGRGTFYGEEEVGGKPVRIRFLWTHPTPDSAHWEQALSADDGKTWDTNWTMEFRRVG